MYEYIKGNITEINPAYAVIETGNIGFFVHISLNTYSQTAKQETGIFYLHQVVREDAQILYGFAEKSEREMFRQLISVSGIGPNTAQMMLSSLSPAEVRTAILEGNVAVLKSTKGIGAKTAQRIIIDLKDKMGKIESASEIIPVKDNTLRDEALSALVTLGFTKHSAGKTVDKILAKSQGLSVEDIVKQSLKML